MSNTVIIQQAQALISLVIANRYDIAAGKNNALPHATEFPYQESSLEPLSPNFEAEQALLQFYHAFYLLLTKETVSEKFFEAIIDLLDDIHQNHPSTFEAMIDEPNANEILIFLYVLDVSNHSFMKFKHHLKLMDAFLNQQSDKNKVILNFLSTYFVKPPEIVLMMANAHSAITSIIQQMKSEHETLNLKNNPIAVWLAQAPNPRQTQIAPKETPDNQAQQVDDLLTSFKDIKASVIPNETETLGLLSEESSRNIADLFLQLSLGSIILNKIEPILGHHQQKIELTLRCLATLKIDLNKLLRLDKVNQLSAYTSILFAAMKYSQAFGLYQDPKSPCRQIMHDLAHRFLIQFPVTDPQESFSDDDMWGLNLALQLLVEDIQFAEDNKKPWPLQFISEEQFWLTCGFFLKLATQQPPRISMLFSGLVNKIYKGYERLGLQFAHSEIFINYKISLCKSMKIIFTILEEDMTISLPWISVDYEEGKALWKTSIECLVEEPRTPQLIYLCSMLMEPLVTTLLTFNLFKETKHLIDAFEDLSGTFQLHKSFDKHVYSSLGLMLLAFERADYIKNISHFSQKNIIKQNQQVTNPQSLQHSLINYTLNALLKACADDFIKNEFSSSVLLIEHLISILDCGKKTDRNPFNITMVHTKNMIEALKEFIQLLTNLMTGNNVQPQSKTKKNKAKSVNPNLLSELFNNNVYSYVPLFLDAIVHYLIEQTRHFFNSSVEVPYAEHSALIIRYNQLKSLLAYLNISREQLDSLAAAFQLNTLEEKRAAIELSLLGSDVKEKVAKPKKKKKKKSSKQTSSAVTESDGSHNDEIDTDLVDVTVHEDNRDLMLSEKIISDETLETKNSLAIPAQDEGAREPTNEDNDWVTIKNHTRSRKGLHQPIEIGKPHLKTSSPASNLTSQAKSLTLFDVATMKRTRSSQTTNKANTQAQPTQDLIKDTEQDKAPKQIKNTSAFAWAKPSSAPIVEATAKKELGLEPTKNLKKSSEPPEDNATLHPIQETLITTPETIISQTEIPNEEITQTQLVSINSETIQSMPFSPTQANLIVPFLPKTLYKSVFTFISVSKLPEEFELLEIINNAFLTFYQEKNRSGMPLVVTGKTVSNFYTQTRPNDLDCSGYNITLIEQEKILRALACHHGWGDSAIQGIVGTKHKILLCKIPYKGREIKIDLSYLPPKQHSQTLLQPLFDDASKRDKLSTAYHLVMYKDQNSNCYPIINALSLASIVLPTGHLKSYLDNDILEINSLLDQNIKQNSAFRQNIFSQDPIRILRFIQDIAETPSIMIGQYLQSYLPSFSNQIAQNNFWYVFLSSPTQSPSKRNQTFFSIGMTLPQSQLSTKLQQMFSKFSHSFEHTQFLYELLDRYGVLTGVINAAILNFDSAHHLERMPEQRLNLVMIVKDEVRRQNTFSNHIPYSALFQLITNVNVCHPHLRTVTNARVTTP